MVSQTAKSQSSSWRLSYTADIFRSSVGFEEPRICVSLCDLCDYRRRGCPDEMIHLASAMQFLGLHCVTGAVCGVSGGGADGVTLTFYKHMVDESDRLDHVRAEQDAMLKLANMSFDQRVRYRDIHVGA